MSWSWAAGWGQQSTGTPACLCRLLQGSQLHRKLLPAKADRYFVCNTQWNDTWLTHPFLPSSCGGVQQWLLTITSKWFYQFHGFSAVNVDFTVLFIICTTEAIDWLWNWVIYEMTGRRGIDFEIPEIIQEQWALRSEYELIVRRQFRSGKLGINCCQNSLDCEYLAGGFEVDIKNLKQVIYLLSLRFIFFLPFFTIEKEIVATVH